VIALNLALSISILPISAQISPGALSEPHAHLEGISNCTKCHILREKVSNEKCLDCHQAIKARISGNRGYHSSPEVKGKDCASCHSDHHGVKFQMIRFDTAQFNHSLTGYNLQGSHSEINCKSCHKRDFITDPGIKERADTYMGLDQQCLTCHADYHQGALSTDCAGCHDFNKFKPAQKFDHNRARFKLVGSHAEVDCAKCHKISVQNGKEIQQFKGLSFGKCTDCHRDIHANKFGQNCTQCHTMISFHQIKGMKSFNHSKTNYPLEGKHNQVACAKCHKAGYSKKLRYNLCTDCHTDYHKKQFMVQGKTPDCSTCHSILGFDQSSFTIEQHNESPYPLKGAHLAIPCFECHKKNETWSFRQIGTNCIDCHKDIHASAMDTKYYPEAACQTCHSNNSWVEIDFDHSKTGYALQGAHLRQSCRSCHFKVGDEGLVEQKFSQLTSSCTECHKDAHQKQFDESAGQGCLKCHDYFDWKAGLFDHNLTQFPLDGRHKNVSCNKCHPKVALAQITYTQYKLKEFRCESCH
jgi:hypothetical protein